MSWTDERVETLKKMWSEGQSASQIAKELGGVTRNAVIGKVHRLGRRARAKGYHSGRPTAAATAQRERNQPRGAGNCAQGRTDREKDQPPRTDRKDLQMARGRPRNA